MAVVIPAKLKWSSVATVRLLVGEAKTVFHIHETVLFEASSFFKAAFTSEFRESSERTMTLPEDNESVCELFVGWLYHQRYDIGVLPARDQPTDMYMRHVQLYVLADKYDVPNLKSFVLSQIFLLIKQKFMPTTSTISYVYQHTSQNAGIRKMFADYLACNFHPEWSQNAKFREWLRKEPEVAIDMFYSVDKHTLKIQNPFGGEMPEEYLNEEQQSAK